MALPKLIMAIDRTLRYTFVSHVIHAVSPYDQSITSPLMVQGRGEIDKIRICSLVPDRTVTLYSS